MSLEVGFGNCGSSGKGERRFVDRDTPANRAHLFTSQAQGAFGSRGKSQPDDKARTCHRESTADQTLDTDSGTMLPVPHPSGGASETVSIRAFNGSGCRAKSPLNMTFLMRVEFPTRLAVRQSASMYTPGIQYTGAFGI